MAYPIGDDDCNKIKSIEFSGNGTTKLKNWTKGDWIGQGAFGRVYKATVDNVTIAVKEIPNISSQDGSNEETVRRETDALKKLSNERIITYYGFCAEDQIFYIFLEFMKGGSLDDFIKEKAKKQETIDEAHAGRIIYQIVDGVAYLHENKVFHRDIKSANVLMSDEENVKLADFGLTKTFEDISKSHTKEVGTLRFMAPEMVRPNSRYSNPVDIWAIGCVAVHMLSGKYPFHEAVKQQVYFILLDKDPCPAKEVLPKVSERCRRFLEKTLAIKPTDRATAQSLLHDQYVLVNGTNLAQIGEHENQVSLGEETDYFTLKKFICEKNPGHPYFIPITSFRLRHLPEGLQDIDLYDFIKAVGELTVRVDVRMTSPNRPDFWPHSKIPYPFFKRKKETFLRSGSGMVRRVRKYTYEYNKQNYFKTCPCDKCKTSDKPSKVWWKVFVHTATYVVFDDIEANHTTLLLFYDSKDSERIIVKDHVHVDSVDIEQDRCTLTCVTCDEHLGNTLETMVKKFVDHNDNVLNKYSASRDIHKLTFIVSHPHGFSKQVSVGHWEDKIQVGNNVHTHKLTYTTCTCLGSAGASVHCVGYTNGSFDIVHSGSLKSGLNMSGVGYILL